MVAPCLVAGLIKSEGFATKASVMNANPSAMTAECRTSTLVLFLELAFLGIMARYFIEAPTPVGCFLEMD